MLLNKWNDITRKTRLLSPTRATYINKLYLERKKESVPHMQSVTENVQLVDQCSVYKAVILTKYFEQ